MMDNDLLPDSQEIYEIDEQFLSNYWRGIVDDETGISAERSRYLFVEGFKKLSAAENDATLLYLKTNGWRISVKRNLIKSLLLAPGIGSILYYLGYTQLTGILLPTILPVLFDIENISLSKSEEQILIRLPVNAGNKEYKTAAEWYYALPPALRKQVNELDFVDFIEKLVMAGYAKKNKKDKYLVFSKGRNIFKIHID